MATDAPQDPLEPDGAPVELPQHDYVTRFRPDPSALAQSALTLDGLVGDSDRPGRKRLYLTKALDYYAEFAVDDVVHSQTVPAEQSPLEGLEVTRLEIRRDAPVEFTRVQAARPADEFDLDVRLAAMPLTARERALLTDGTEPGTRTLFCQTTFVRTLLTTVRIPTDVCGTRQPTWVCPPTDNPWTNMGPQA